MLLKEWKGIVFSTEEYLKGKTEIFLGEDLQGGLHPRGVETATRRLRRHQEEACAKALGQ